MLRPTPLPDEVVIAVECAAFNFMDLEKLHGTYPDPAITHPLILGNEVSGTICRTGAEVADLRVGDAVAGIVAGASYAEQVIATPSTVIKIPDIMTFQTAASFPISTLTAYHLLHSAHPVGPGQTVLVHAVGSALGLALCQLIWRSPLSSRQG